MQYTLTLSGITGDGALTIEIAANTLTDAAGNKNDKNTLTPGITVDNTIQTVTITANKTSRTNSTSITYTFEWSESVTGFTADDITVTNGTKGTLTTVTSGTKYTMAVTYATDNVEVTQTVKVVANAVYDKAQNNNAETSKSIVIDHIDPVWTYSSKDIYYSTANDVGNDNYANAGRTVKIVFKGTDANGHVVTSSLTKSNITVKVNSKTISDTYKTLETTNNGTSEVTCTLTIDLDETSAENGDLTVSIAAGTLADDVTDTTKNTNAATALTTDINIDIDNTSPTVSLSITSPAAGYYKAGQVITITATYTENVYKEITSNNLIDTTAEAPTMSLKFGGTNAKGGNATCTAVNGKVLTYTYTITGADNTAGTNGDNGKLVISSLATVYDAAGNAVSASNVTPSIEIIADTIIPTLTITANRTSPTNASSITYTFTFSENVYNFVVDDITLTATQSKATKGTFSGSGTTYTLVVNTVDEVEEKVTVSVAANACNDIAGNGNKAASSTEIVVDRINPTLTITANKTTPTNATSITYTFTFSEAVTGFATEDIVLTATQSKATKGTFTATSSTVYTLVVNTVANVEETVTVSVAADKCVDKAQNGNVAASSTAIVVDRIIPTLTITANRTSPTNATSITYTFTFSENVTEFVTGDITLTATQSKATKGTFSGSGKTYTLVVNTVDDVAETITVSVAANKCVDKAQNGNTAATSTGILADRVDPTWSTENINIDKANKRVTVDLVGTDAHSGYASNSLDIGDITVKVDGETASSITKALSSASSVTGGGVKYTLTLTTWEQSTKQSGKDFFEWSGTTVITVAASTLTDNATNANQAQNFTLGHADFIQPKIENLAKSKTTNTQTITFSVFDKYINGTIVTKTTQASNVESDAEDEIVVYVDGDLATGITKTLTTTNTYTATVNGTSKTVGYDYQLVISGFEQSARNSKNFKDYSGTVSIKIKAGAVADVVDGSGQSNTNNVANYTGDFIDCINPDIKYVYSAGTASTEGDINHTNETFTVVFDITDKYFNTTPLTQSTLATYLTIKVDGTDVTSLSNVTKTLTVADVTAGAAFNKTVSGSVTSVAATTVVGKRYTLVISALDQGLGINYSGVVTIALKTGIVTDTTSNKNIAKTLTSGISLENGATSGSQKVVDVVDPIWKLKTGSVSINYSTQTVTAIIVAEDKYLDTTNTTLATDGSDITVKVDGETASSITKAVAVSTTGTTTKEFTLTLTGWEQSTKQTGKDFYEWSGTTTITIAAGKARDIAVDGRYNTNNATTLSLGHIDVIKPKVEQVSQNVSDQKQLIVFNVLDKYLDTTDDVTVDELTVLVDNDPSLTGIEAEIVSVTEIKATVNGNANHVVGKQYSISISGFGNESSLAGSLYDVDGDGTDDYLDGNGNASGTVTVVVAEGASKDTSNNINAETTLTGSFMDNTNPAVIYRYTQTDINRTGKSITIKFDITDKYYTSSTFDTSDLIIKLDNDVLWTGGAQQANKPTVSISSITDRKIFVGTADEKVIGKSCTITISNFEKDDSTTAYIDYGGVVTVAISADVIKDNRNAGNVATTLTMGIDLTEGTGTAVEVDFIKPVWTMSGYTVDATNKQATVTLTGTDEFLNECTLPSGTALTDAQISVKVDGETASSITRKLSNPTYYDASGNTVTGVTITNMRAKNVVKIVYTLTLSGWEQSSKQTGKGFLEWSGTPVITVAAGTLKDSTNIGDGDTYSYSNDAYTFTGTYTDFIQPRLEEVSVNNELVSSLYDKQVRVFNVYDKYLNTSDDITASEVTVTIDGTTVTGKTLTSTNLTATVNGTSKTVGKQYTLTLTGFKDAGLSGTVAVSIPLNSTKDNAGNTLYNTTTNPITLTSYFIDPIAPVIADGTAANTLTSGLYDTQTRTFTVTEKHLGTTDHPGTHVARSNIKVYLNDNTSGTNKTDITSKVLTADSQLTHTTSGGVTTYTLTLNSFKANGLSGYVTVEIAANAAKDCSHSGVEDNELGTSAITLQYYFIDPIVPVLADSDAENTLTSGLYDTQIRKFTLTEKYFGTGVARSSIKVYMNDDTSGTNKTDITSKVLTADSQLTSSTSGSVVTYTLTLNNFKANGLSGFVTVEIAASAAKDSTVTTAEDNALTTSAITLKYYFIDPIAPVIADGTAVNTATSGLYDTQTRTFTVTEKHLGTTAHPGTHVARSNIKVYLNDDTSGTNKTDITSKVLTADSQLTHTTSSGVTTYTLTLNNFKANGLSGYVTVEIAANAAKDCLHTTSGTCQEVKAEDNELGTSAITLKYYFIDPIAPVIADGTAVNTATSGLYDTQTRTFTVTEKHLGTTAHPGTHVARSNITVYMNDNTSGTNKTDITSKVLTADSQLTHTTSAGVTTYTLTLNNFKANGLSGYVTVEIAAGAAKDSKVTTAEDNELGTSAITLKYYFIDPIKPVITSVSSEVSGSTQTIVFDATDKYLDLTDTVTTGEITVYVDGEQADSVSKAISVDSSVAGRLRHTLTLTNWEQTARNSKDYKDWSGTVSIQIAANAVSDVNKTGELSTGKPEDNVLKNEGPVTIQGKFIDVIKPNLKYTFATSDIDKTNDTYKMVFDITDKYYTSGQLALANITSINIYNGKETIDLKTALGTSAISLSAEPKYATSVNYTETDGTVTTGKSQIQIGHTYTLTITNLDNAFIESGDTTANYSGVVTIAIAGDIISDRTANSNTNKNVATSLTSGISVANGSTSGSEAVVDTVNPIWEKVSTSAYAVGQTATITVKGTDTYFIESSTDAKSLLSADEIEVYVNGTKNTSITPTVTLKQTLTEERTVGGVTDSSVQYGVQYEIGLSGFAQDANQVKIKILADAIVDQSGNGNKATEFIAYNVLKVAETGDTATHEFLGGPNGAEIQRQNIEHIVFKNSLSGAPVTIVNGIVTAITDEAKAWDISAQQDMSIIAWTTNTSAPYTVNIGSNWEIFGNQNSSYLFKYIGYSSNCDDTTVFTNINLLNTKSVTDMSNMFQYCGYNAMTTFDLGDSFYTNNVTDMSYMFQYVGYTAMTSFSFGSNFNTSNVTDMSYMFRAWGYNTMGSVTGKESLDLSTVTFNTAKVINMEAMFRDCGYKTLKVINLGSNFNTSNVETMKHMFYYAGFTALRELNLGTNFDTSKVTNMALMFAGVARTSTTFETLDLGELFDTSLVEDMNSMFYRTGAKGMTTLDLGPNFNTSNVKIMHKMFYGCGQDKLTSLDLGNLFSTESAEAMGEMFYTCGQNAMTVLDLGPLFTQIPSGDASGNVTVWEISSGANKSVGANTNMFTNTGTSTCVIYAPEAIYEDLNSFKLQKVPTT